MSTTLKLLCALVLLTLLCPSLAAQEDPIRLGIVGCDTSHVIRFTQYLNDPENNTGCRIVAAFPGGSPDIPLSADRIEGFTARLHDEFRVEIVSSIETLCQRVDGVLLESVDGRCHLEQAKAVFAARKPVFIDKPLAAGLEDAVEILRLAEEGNVPCWSASALRFAPAVQSLRSNEDLGDVLGCSTYGPCAIEEHHPDLYWYGVHGAEVLFTLMGPGCQSVARTHTDDYDLVVATWSDGRIGTYRGIRHGKASFGAVVYGSNAIEHTGPIGGYYEGIGRELADFFRTGKPPVSHRETLEIFAFMTAADLSKHRGGAPVALEEVLNAATKKPSPQDRRPDSTNPSAKAAD
ncbi:MAG: Gfo/Idh/MocA family oxidoreductase [Sedimentisphaerales bacterium]|nr:Gfo/Idh/MocA family oxidoreductase [Sedimentisphaerales bacterium]